MVFFDSGGTHSFISKECVRRLKLVMRELGCELIISTPAFGEVSTNFVCVGCHIEVAGRGFKVNLIFLLMEALGMEWLSCNHIITDYNHTLILLHSWEKFSNFKTCFEVFYFTSTVDQRNEPYLRQINILEIKLPCINKQKSSIFHT